VIRNINDLNTQKKKDFTPFRNRKVNTGAFITEGNKRFLSGFSLAEMLVVMAIMAVLATITILPYRQYQNRKNLDLAAQEIKSAIVESINMSLAPKESVNGYGVYLEIDPLNENKYKYYVFADKDKNKMYDPNEEIRNIKYFKIYENISISDMNPDPGADKKISILFTLPQKDPDISEDNPGLSYKRETLIDATTSASKEINIKIKLKNSTLNKEIKLNTYTNNVYVK